MPAKLLYLSQTLPYPPDSGSKIRTYHTLRILSRDFEITALCFYRRRQTNPGGVSTALSELEQFAVVDAFAIPQEWSRLRWVRDHALSLFSGAPYTDLVFSCSDYSERLDEVLERQEFEVVHFESPSLALFMGRVGRLPRVCVHHNVESQLLRRRARLAANPLTAAYLRLQARRLRATEARVCPAMDINITVSDEDTETFRRIAPDARYLMIPNGVDTEYFRPDTRPTSGIALLGGTDWLPNLDGLEFFAEEVLPLVRAHRPDVQVVSVGRASEEEVRRFDRDHDIELTGYVDDIRPFIQDARCVAVPLRVGGGSRLKILDSWAMGKPVVTTTIGCEGLSARNGENALVEDDPQAFADALLRLLGDPELARGLGQAARDEAVNRYSWEAIADPMRRAYYELRGKS